MPFLSLLSADLSTSVRYNVLTSLVQPRPIALVSTIGSDGIDNLAPFSFFMVGGANPASLMISPVLGSSGRKKDTLRNIEDTGEFVVNLVHGHIVHSMNRTSAKLPPEESEWDLGGFSKESSLHVRPSRVAESKAQLECRLFQIVPHGEGESAACYVIAEVVAFHVEETIWRDDGILDFRSIARMGGAHYLDSETMQVIELVRPG